MLLCLKRNEVSIAVSPISPHVVVVVVVVVVVAAARQKDDVRAMDGLTNDPMPMYAGCSNPKEVPIRKQMIRTESTNE